MPFGISGSAGNYIISCIPVEMIRKLGQRGTFYMAQSVLNGQGQFKLNSARTRYDSHKDLSCMLEANHQSNFESNICQKVRVNMFMHPPRPPCGYPVGSSYTVYSCDAIALDPGIHAKGGS